MSPMAVTCLNAGDGVAPLPMVLSTRLTASVAFDGTIRGRLRGFQRPHIYSHLDTLTVGALRDFFTARWTRLGIGADVMLYHMSPDLVPYYEGSHSYHLFVRWRPNAISSGHVH